MTKATLQTSGLQFWKIVVIAGAKLTTEGCAVMFGTNMGPQMCAYCTISIFNNSFE